MCFAFTLLAFFRRPSFVYVCLKLSTVVLNLLHSANGSMNCHKLVPLSVGSSLFNCFAIIEFIWLVWLVSFLTRRQIALCLLIECAHWIFTYSRKLQSMNIFKFPIYTHLSNTGQEYFQMSGDWVKHRYKYTFASGNYFKGVLMIIILDCILRFFFLRFS